MFYGFMEDYVKQIDGRRRQEAVAERLYALARAQRHGAREAALEATCRHPLPERLEDCPR